MARTDFVPKVVVNPYGFARICTLYTHESHSKGCKFIRLVRVSLWLSGSVLIFRAEGSRFEDSSGRWLVHLSFDWTYLVKGLWLCLRELWHSVINTTQHVDNSRKLIRVLWLGHIRISVGMRAGCTSDILTKNGGVMRCDYTFYVFQKNITKVRWLSLIFLKVSFDAWQ